jgi:hypothetical protein
LTPFSYLKASRKKADNVLKPPEDSTMNSNRFYLLHLNKKYLAASLLCLFPAANALSATGHCNISADKKWIERQSRLYEVSEDPKMTIKGNTHKQFNDMVAAEKKWLQEKKRTVPQDMKRCGNSKNIDGSKDRDQLAKLNEFDKSLSGGKGNLTCLCDNDTKKNKDGAENPMTAKVAEPPRFSDGNEPHVNPPLRGAAAQQAPVLSQEQQTLSTLANPGTLSPENKKLMDDGQTYSYYGKSQSPTTEGWTLSPNTFKDDHGRPYEIWTRGKESWARQPPQ